MEAGAKVAGRLNRWIVSHPGRVVLAFLLLTAVFATGIDDIEMSSGTEQFSEDVDAYGLNEEVEETFEPSFDTDGETTLLLQRDENVLSRRGMLRMLEVQHRMEDRSSLRVTATSSAATVVARELDPSATTTEDQIRAVRTATDAEVRGAVRRAASDPAFAEVVGEDFNAREASASATIGLAEHDVQDDDELFEAIQLETRRVTDSVDGDVRVFGTGITDYENKQVLKDSLSASIPAVVVLLLLFLAIAYRDPFDLLLGVLSLGMALVWTFGFLGLAGIPFSQLQVSLPPLLLAIGVDFGIHIINRYREEFDGHVVEAMDRAVSPLMGAFFMVMATSVIGFSANTTSGLSPIADFGLAAAVGIVAVTLIFSIFLPAAKILLETLRRRTRLPVFDAKPLGAEDSLLGRALPVHLGITNRMPLVFLALVVLTAGMAGYYGQSVDSSFEDEDMLPPEDLPDYIGYLPGPMEPGTYTTTESLHFLEEEFETSPDDTVTVYLQGSLAEDTALESVHRMGEDPPDSFVVGDPRRAESDSVLTVIDDYAERSPSFAALVERNDRDGNGVPDTGLEEIYDELLSSPYGDRAGRYLTEDYREMRVVYSVETDATDAAVTADAATVAEDSRFDAVETGDVVVFQRVSEEVFRSAVTSLAIALSLAAAFLLALYHVHERRAMLGLVTLSPIVVTVLFLVATMRLLGIPFNTLTATILSVTVGIGIDYSIHVVHRFVEEFDALGDPVAAARVTLRGTGGALFGTTITTVSAGAALHYLSMTPILVQFGALISFSVTYSFVTSVVVLPVVLVVWTRWDAVRGAGDVAAVAPRSASADTD